LPENVARLIAAVQWRWLVRSIALAIAVAGAMFGAVLVVFDATVPAAGAAISILALMVARAGRLSRIDAAGLVEKASPGFDNLLITVAELEDRPRPIRAELQSEILRQAEARARAVTPAGAVPLRQPILVASVVAIGCALVAGAGGDAIQRMINALPNDVAAGVVSSGSFEVRVTPPAYTGRKPEAMRDPVQVTVLAGSRVQIIPSGRDWIATASEALEVAVAGTDPRFLSVVVVPDLPPAIRIVAPGKDTAFAEPRGQLAIGLQSGDDLGLASLALRYTKASGGGENVAFTEGELPLRIERRNPREWIGRADLSIDSLDLAEGDVVVYRAVARDTNPGGAPALSDQYLIEIGKNASIADAGFALPSEEKKYAISQQMVIYKTEQLLAANRRPGAGGREPEAWLEQSRFIGMEQRMVRAEVVFLSGGAVEDEVEEAAHSHELAEGRLENAGRAEMVRAINAMSRAEQQLNDGRVKEALVFEREALVHLERALDRRRYFLRTLPDRSRIDITRRLSGDRREARSWARQRGQAIAPGSMEAQRQLMRDLASGAAVNAALAARIAAIDPASSELQKAAVAVASASTEESRTAAAREAMAAITAHALKSLPSSGSVDLYTTPLAGRLADESRRRTTAGQR
jgi:hypothetical protein